MPVKKGPATLSEMEAAFVRAFVGEARGRIGKAAELAGYSARTSWAQGSRLLKRVKVRQAIARAQERALSRAIATNEQLDGILSSIAMSSRNEKNRIKAIEVLFKRRGLFSLKLQVGEGATLEDAIAASRRAKPVEGTVIEGQTVPALPAKVEE
jgi:phage terminase small subunit